MITQAPKLVEWFDQHWYKVQLPDGTTDYFPSTTTILGVTSKPFLAKWRGDIGNREADLRMVEAAERGTRLHNAWSIYCQGGVVVYQPHQRPIHTFQEIDEFRSLYADRVAILPTQEEMYQMTKLEKWYMTVKPFKTITESTVFSIRNRRAGTADNFLAIDEGEYKINGSKSLYLKKGLYVVDLKTGSTVDDDAYMQISDYASMLFEMAELGVEWAKELQDEFKEIAGGLIIHTSAKTKNGIEGLATLLRTKEELQQDQADMQSISVIWQRKNRNSKPDVFEFPAVIARDINPTDPQPTEET